jgi:hypothetical protein
MNKNFWTTYTYPSTYIPHNNISPSNSNLTLTNSNLTSNDYLNQTHTINVSDITLGNITLNSDIDYSIGNLERIKKLEKQLDKIINFINTFFDTDIKV